jgi:hypothetical protein
MRKAAGISPDHPHYRTIASLPEPECDAHRAETKAAGQEQTSGEVDRQATQPSARIGCRTPILIACRGHELTLPLHQGAPVTPMS